MEGQFDWSTVVKKVYIETDKQTVTDAWLKADGLNLWFFCAKQFTPLNLEKREATLSKQAIPISGVGTVMPTM